MILNIPKIIVPATTEIPSGEHIEEIETLVTSWMRENHVSGASLAIVDGDETVYESGFGARNREQNDPATPNTLYEIGSATKPFTALAVAQLIENNEVSLEDPIFEHVPALEAAPGEPITVEQLLTHSSGMPSDGLAVTLVPRLALGVGSTTPLSSESDFYHHVNGAADRRVTDTGEKFLYYNSGYVLLGKLVEAVTGRSFAAYVTEKILEPLGMDRSTFDRQEFEASTDTMTPYFWNGEEVQRGGTAIDETLAGAGGLLSSVDDLAAFISGTVTGTVPSNLPDVDAEALEAMQCPQAVMSTRLDGRELQYGSGWMTKPFLDDALVGHGGATVASSVGYWGLRDGSLGVAVACNTTPEVSPRSIGEAVLAVLHDRDPEETVPPLMLRKKYERVTGEYASYRDTQSVTVEQEGQTLQLTHDTPFGARTQPLFPETLSPDDLSFYTVTKGGTRVPIEFYVADDGTLKMEQRRVRYDET